MNDTYRLSQCLDVVRQVLLLNFDSPIWVLAEITQVRESRGHLYIQLAEKDQDGRQVIAQSDAVIWSSKNTALSNKYKQPVKTFLQEGHEIRLLMQLEFHPVYGMKWHIEDVDIQYTFGQLALRRRAIITALTESGLLKKNSTTNMPSVVQRIAIVTSEQAAGWQDFKEQLTGNIWGYVFEMKVYPASMQGENLEAEVCAALRKIKRKAKNHDIVVMIRGGGSKLDLAWFDNQAVGEAIANMPLPVLTGIGHDIDETVADLCAWLSLKTPTACASWILDHNLQFESTLIQQGERINKTARRIIAEAVFHLNSIAQTMKHAIQHQLQHEHFRIQHAMIALKENKANWFKKSFERLSFSAKLIEAVTPSHIMKLGYTITMHRGKTIYKPDELPEGAVIETRFLAGTLLSKKIKSNEESN